MEGKAKLLCAIIGAVIIISAGVYYAKTAGADVPENLRCSLDEDCVPASCCHASSAVNRQFAPSCAGIKCTMECAPNTLDCRQGEIKCAHNICKAILEK
jgi:hypothetical protein